MDSKNSRQVVNFKNFLYVASKVLATYPVD